MSSGIIKASKITVMKMALTMEDIVRIFRSVESEYTVARRRLAEAHSILYKDPKKAYRLILKANAEMIEESRAAQEYNRFRRIIPQVTDAELSKLDSKYKQAIEKGDYKAAREAAVQMSKCKVITDAGHSISARLVSQGDGKLCYLLENASTQDVIIKRFNVICGGTVLKSDVSYPFAVRHNSPLRVFFDCEDSKETASASIEYSENGIVKVLSFESVLKGGADE